MINGEGGSVGPDLSNEGKRERSREWLITQIRNPKAHVPTSLMPPFTSLSDQQVNYIVDYLMSLGKENAQSAAEQKKDAGTDPTAAPGTVAPLPSTNTKEHQHLASGEEEQKNQPSKAAYVIGNADHGKDIFEQKCASCHGPQGTDKVPNPGSDDGFVPALNPIDRELFSKEPQTFAKNIDVFIQHGSVPSGHNPQFRMLAFGDDHTLTQQQIANVEAYILHLNGVNRAELVNPGLSPGHFFFIVVPTIVLILLILGGIYKCLPGN
jgi:mono/diheme cytochrome c family protein